MKKNELLEKITSSLDKKEKIVHATEGYIKNSRGPLVLTNKAIYFEGKQLWETESECIPLSKIVSLSNASSIVFGEIKIKTQGESVTIRNMKKKDAEEFVRAFNNFRKE